MRRSLTSALLFLLIISNSPVLANPTAKELIRGTRVLAKLWREASLPQNRASPEEVIERYQRVIDTSAYLESPFKKWYLAVTHFGLARAYSRLGSTDSARAQIQLAIDHNFWNFDVMYADPVLRSCLGIVYLDSLSQAYSIRRTKEETNWRIQVPIVHGPQEGRIWRAMGNIDAWFTDAELRGHTLDSMYKVRWNEMIAAAHSTTKPNVIIALHGGNASYREFGSHWAMIGQSTNSYVITPPGIVRYSKIMNSWDTDYSAIDDYLLGIIENLRDEQGALPPIYLAGFSQGGCIGLKFGLLHPEIIKGVMCFSGFMDTPIPGDLVSRARDAGMRVFAESGEFDSENFKNSLLELKASFDKVAAPFTYIEKKQMIHELPEHLVADFSDGWRHIVN